jgi:hypothetical protein
MAYLGPRGPKTKPEAQGEKNLPKEKVGKPPLQSTPHTYTKEIF